MRKSGMGTLRATTQASKGDRAIWAALILNWWRKECMELTVGNKQRKAAEAEQHIIFPELTGPLLLLGRRKCLLH